MITRDVWLSLQENKKVEKIAEALTELKDLKNKNCRLKKNMSQGRIANIKKDLESFVINAVDWESTRQLQRHY